MAQIEPASSHTQCHAQMPEHHGWKVFGKLRTPASVMTVMIALGLIVGFGAANARNAANQGASDLVALVHQRQSVVDHLGEQTSSLKSQVDTYAAQMTSGQASPNRSNVDLQAVSGPGVEVTLTDAPPGPLPTGVSPDDLVIHQQDIEDVMNALWAGGAEAMTVQNQRITNRSVVRCIGNVVLIDGTPYSPPYKIAAIGDIERLSERLNSDPRIVNYQVYVALYGLGWNVKTRKDLTFEAASDELTLKYAQVEDHG